MGLGYAPTGPLRRLQETGIYAFGRIRQVAVKCNPRSECGDASLRSRRNTELEELLQNLVNIVDRANWLSVSSGNRDNIIHPIILLRSRFELQGRAHIVI